MSNCRIKSLQNYLLNVYPLDAIVVFDSSLWPMR